MAFDEDLAVRVRELIDHEWGLTEKRMFGGLAMLLDGNMAVVIRGKGGLMVRVDPAECEAGPDRARRRARGDAGPSNAGLDHTIGVRLPDRH